jgi:hypothetical protein
VTLSTKAESVRSSLHELEELLEKYSPMIDGSTEKVLDAIINYGAVLAEVRPPDGNQHDIESNHEGSFGVARVTFNVRAHYACTGTRDNAGPCSLERTKQI